MRTVCGIVLLLGAVVVSADVTICPCDDPEAWEGPVSRDAEHVKTGPASIRWDYAGAKVITRKSIPSDWTQANTLTFWVYSNKPLVHRPWIVVRGKGGKDRWAIAVLRIDFSGWHRFVIPLDEFKLRRGAEFPDWSKMESISFDCTHPGWLTGPADPKTVLRIDDIRLTTISPPGIGEGPRMTDEQFFQALDLQRPELATVKEALDKKDYSAAKHAFAEHIRKRRTPRWFDMWWERPKPNPKYKEYWVGRIMAGEYKMGEAVYKPGDRIDWSYNPPVYCDGPKRTVEYNAALNRFYHIKYLHEAYWNTGRDEYAQLIAKEIVNWIEDCPVLLHQTGNSPYHYAWETLNAAARVLHYWMHSFFRTLDNSAWTDDAIVKFAKSMCEHAQHLKRCYSARGNWRTSETRAIFTIGTLFPEFKLAPVWRAKGLALLLDQLDREVYPDGLQFELAVGYNMSVLKNFESVLDLAKLNSTLEDVPREFRDRMEKMYNYLVYAMAPNGAVPGRNDAGKASSANDRYKQAVKFFPKREDFRWAATQGKEGKAPPPDSVAFPYTGHYVMRTGWDKQDLYMMFDAGPLGAAHQHEDKLGFTVQAYGQTLITEAGVVMYDASPQRQYVLSTRGHNTIRVDGFDQRRKHVKSTWTLPHPFKPIKNPWLTDPEFDFAEGRYEQGYGPTKSRKIEAKAVHTRSILFVKPHYWIITDIVESKDGKEHSYESLFHLEAKEAAANGLTVSSRNDGANMHIIAAPAAGLDVAMVIGQKEPEMQGWTQQKFTTVRPIPTPVYRWKSAGISRVTYVLCPTPKGKSCPVKDVKQIPVTAENGDAVPATAVAIRFEDGSRHVYFYADPGVGKCRYDRFASDGRCALIKLNAEGQVADAWQGFGKTLLCDGKPLVTKEYR